MKNSRGMIMIIAAAYIGYLGIKIIRDMIAPDINADTPENPVLFIIIGVVFIIAAAFIIVKSVKEIVEAKKEQEEEERLAQEAGKAEKALNGENDPETDKEGKCEAPEQDRPMSIADRIKLLSADEEADEIPEEDQ